MNDIKKMIEYLTSNGTYASHICEHLFKHGQYQILSSLIKLNIIGKDLETLFGLCDFQSPYHHLIETVKFLSLGYIDKVTIIDNLHSENPIPFISELRDTSNDQVYTKYTNEFHRAFRANRSKFNKK